MVKRHGNYGWSLLDQSEAWVTGSRGETLREVVVKLADAGVLAANPGRARIGPAMRQIRDHVSARPGCCKSEALAGSGRPPNGLGCWRIIQRALASGVVFTRYTRWAETTGDPLFASESDFAMFEARGELLRGSPSPERAEELRGRVEELRAEQARAYAAAEEHRGH
jgi:hypothetical protein